MNALEKVGSTRRKFTHQGFVVYEWSQNVEEVEIFVPTPPGCKAAHLEVEISTRKVRVGLKGNPERYLDHEVSGKIITSESLWTHDSSTSTLSITLAKAKQGEVWPSVFIGHELSDAEIQEEKRLAMLQRFQLEHPGMDFSGATFNGEIPKAHEFMGGMKKI